MNIDAHLAARLRALRSGRAVLKTAHQQVCIHEDAMVLAAVEMAGEDATIHAVALGRVGQPPVVLSCADPRNRDEQLELFEALGAALEPYLEQCLNEQRAPQLWVSNGGVGSALQNVADRMRYTKLRPDVVRAGNGLTHFTERQHITGQQSLISATEALCAHWATGQTAGEDQHLGTVLTWIQHHGGNLQSAIEQAEGIPMGFNTLPSFDRTELAPLLKKYAKAKKHSDAVWMSSLKSDIDEALRTVVVPIYDGIQQAIALLNGLALPPLSHLSELQSEDEYAFAKYMENTDNGWITSHRDSIKQAAQRVVNRESAKENAEAGLVLSDPVALECAIQNGRAIRGVVGAVHKINKAYWLTLTTTQPHLRARQRDSLVLAADTRMAVLVGSTQRASGQVQLRLRITKGQRAVGIPSVGDTLVFVSKTPDKWRAIRKKIQLRNRTAVLNWTHEDNGIPAAIPRIDAPADPLAALETLS